MKYRYPLALAAAITSTAFGTMPAHMPEFKNEKQLAEWRAEKAAESTVKATTEDTAFYTGKPYVASTGGYAFKYRSYNPELARWTSEDPSGFPDGANNSFYAPVPTSQIDLNGLSAGDLSIVGAVIEGWKSLGFTYSVFLAEHSLSGGSGNNDRTSESNEINSLKTASAFTNLFNKGYFDNNYGSSSNGTYSGSDLVDYRGFSDLGYSYGRVTFNYDVTVTSNSGTHSYNVDYRFSDPYDFAPDGTNSAANSPIAAFNRLQEGGIAVIFDSSGSFSKSYE